jgi:hypothetical protein
MLMRFVLLTLLCGLLAGNAGALTITVPDEELEITQIQEGVDLAAPGDTVMVLNGTYDNVHAFDTPLGRRDAIVALTSDITLVGQSRTGVNIDYLDAQYGILCMNVGPDAVISNLGVRGGAGRDRGRVDDGDGRALVASICCIDAASPTIRNVDLQNGATGVVVRTGPGSEPSAPTLTGVLVARGSHHGVYVYENGPEPVMIDRCTLVSNFDYGVYIFGGEVEITNSAVTNNGKYGVTAYQATPTVRYCNVYWNDRMFPDSGVGPLEYGGDISDQTGINGNISAEPYYCDFAGSSGYDYHVCFSDPPSPNYQAGEGGVTIGAFQATCTGCLSPVEEVTWGAIKSLYRP